MRTRIPDIILTVALTSLPCFPQTVITEIQRDPAGAESASPGGLSHEFVEIANFGSDTFRIDSLFLTDGMEADALIPWPDTLAPHRDCVVATPFVAPGQTAIVLDRDYTETVRQHPASALPIAAGTLLLTVSDAELGNGLAGDDGLLLYKGTATRVDTVLWCAAASPFSGSSPTAGRLLVPVPRGSPEGYSVIPASFLFDTARYTLCGDSLTPGRFELLQSGLFAETRFGEPDTSARTISCTLACIASGQTLHSQTSWHITVTSSGGVRTVASGTFVAAENRGTATASLPLDSAAYLLRINHSGNETVWPLDLSALWSPATPVRISEIFPRANAGEPEWFELVNVSSMPINLANWTFGNSEGADTLSHLERLLPPGGYLAVTANLSLFKARYPAKNAVVQPPRWRSLDNYNDTLCLWDATGRRKEIVCYRGSWFTGWTTQSLERTGLTAPGTEASSWTLASRPSPGQPGNSAVWRNVATPALGIGPLPFTPNNDGIDDRLAIDIEAPADATVSISIYGFSGSRLRTLGTPSSRQIFWDGRLDNGSPAPLGPFFVIMETTSGANKTTLRKKGVVWR